MDKLPPSFNWVQARHACSPRSIFELLKIGAAEDVKFVNDLRGKEQFTLVSDPSGELFSVIRVGSDPERLVNFSIADTELSIKPSIGSSFRVTLALNSSGECKVKIKGRDEELELWQLLRMGLEELFFETTS